MQTQEWGHRTRAVVTGGSSGIGEAIARRLAEGGAAVLLVGRNDAELDRVAAGIATAGGVAHPCRIDLADRDAARHVVDAALAAMGGLDILVNCASLTRNEDFFALSDEHWQAAFDVKVLAAIRLCREAWPALRNGRGSIVNICGIGARTPLPMTAITAATSSALLAVTKALAQAGIADGVQVNAINPGLIRTPRIERMFGAGSEPAEEVEAAFARSSALAGTVRAGRPEDVAALVAYIVSPAGELLQGAAIDLDGGATKGL